MSYNFLPFINEDSSEASILKAILQRTKGMSHSDIQLLLNLIVHKGVGKVREALSKMSNNTTASKKLSELVLANQDYKISKADEDLSYAILLNEHKPKTTLDYSEIHKILPIFIAIVGFKKENLKKAGFEFDIAKYSNINKTGFDISTNDIPTKFATREDASTRVGFCSWEELKAYVMYKKELGEPEIICPVFIGKDLKAARYDDYEKLSCHSPYA